MIFFPTEHLHMPSILVHSEFFTACLDNAQISVSNIPSHYSVFEILSTAGRDLYRYQEMKKAFKSFLVWTETCRRCHSAI